MNPILYHDRDLVSDALLKYYELNHLPADGGADDKWSRYMFGPFTMIAFPNFQHRKDAIIRHDLHHIVNNFDTSARGEGLIAAWELGSGCGRYWISWIMEPQALWWGLLFAPHETFRTFLIGRKSLNFFKVEFKMSEVKNKTVGEIRKSSLPHNSTMAHSSLWDLVLFTCFLILGLFMMFFFFPILFLFSTYGIVTRQK